MAQGRDRFADFTGVSHETLTRFDSYAAQLREWNQKINLVGPATLADVWTRHFLDSAQLYRLLPKGAVRLADLGSGAGFPGLVLALMGVSEVHLLESDQRKAVFLREVSRVTDSSHVTIHAGRIEAIAPVQADVVTARALAPLEKLIPLALRHLRDGGACVFLKGAEAENEIAVAGRIWSFEAETFPSQTSSEGLIVRLTAIKPRSVL